MLKLIVVDEANKDNKNSFLNKSGWDLCGKYILTGDVYNVNFLV